MGWAGAVSYTHLDVYKRQLKERGMRKEDLRLAAGLTTNMIANMGKGKNISMETPVSYTHLDVYKRQP